MNQYAHSRVKWVDDNIKIHMWYFEKEAKELKVPSGATYKTYSI